MNLPANAEQPFSHPSGWCQAFDICAHGVLVGNLIKGFIHGTMESPKHEMCTARENEQILYVAVGR